jgi:hypothetical protein
MYVCWYVCLDTTVAMVSNVAAHCAFTIITFVTNVQTFVWVPLVTMATKAISVGCCVYAPQVFRPADFSCLVFL